MSTQVSLDRVLEQSKGLAALEPDVLDQAMDAVVGASSANEPEIVEALTTEELNSTLAAALKGVEAKTPGECIAEFKAIIGLEAKTSEACSRCPAACCRRFWMPVAYKVLPNRGHRSTPWHTRVRFEWGKRGLPPPVEEQRFMESYFKVAPDNINNRRRRTTKRGCWGTAWRHETKVPKIRELALTCKALVNNRCSKYEERPQACRSFLCTEARNGMTPIEAGTSKDYPGCRCTKTLKRTNRVRIP